MRAIDMDIVGMRHHLQKRACAFLGHDPAAPAPDQQRGNGQTPRRHFQHGGPFRLFIGIHVHRHEGRVPMPIPALAPLTQIFRQPLAALRLVTMGEVGRYCGRRLCDRREAFRSGLHEGDHFLCPFGIDRGADIHQHQRTNRVGIGPGYDHADDAAQ